jgi:hypothetical protein
LEKTLNKCWQAFYKVYKDDEVTSPTFFMSQMYENKSFFQVKLFAEFHVVDIFFQMPYEIRV